MVCQGPYWQLRERMIKIELYVLPKLSLCSHRLSGNAFPLPPPPISPGLRPHNSYVFDPLGSHLQMGT